MTTPGDASPPTETVSKLVRKRPGLAWLLALLLVPLLLTALLLGLRTGPIQDDLKTRSLAALQAQSISGADVDLSGRDAFTRWDRRPRKTADTTTDVPAGTSGNPATTDDGADVPAETLTTAGAAATDRGNDVPAGTSASAALTATGDGSGASAGQSASTAPTATDDGNDVPAGTSTNAAPTATGDGDGVPAGTSGVDRVGGSPETVGTPAAASAEDGGGSAGTAVASQAGGVQAGPVGDVQAGRVGDVAEGRFGVGSADSRADGQAPYGFTIKGNADSMLFHTTDSPYYGRTKAEAWFRTEADAARAGFTRWDRRTT